MVDPILATIIALAIMGAAGLLIAPREKKKITKPVRKNLEGLDDYALLYRLAEEGRYRDVVKMLKRLRRRRGAEINVNLRHVEEEVLKWIRRQSQQ